MPCQYNDVTILNARHVVRRILSWELIVVAIAVGMSVLSTRLLPIAGAVCAVFLLLKVISGYWVRLPGIGFIVLLGVMMIVTMVITPLPQVTITPVLRLFTGICLFFSMTGAAAQKSPALDLGRFRLPPSLPMLLASFTLAGAAIALSAPVSVNWAAGKVPALSALYADFRVLLQDSVHPNVMAGTLVILLPLPIALLLFRQARVLPVLLWWTCVFIMAAIFLLTLSRGGYMGMASALLAIVVIRWRKVRYVALAGLLGIGLALIFVPALRESVLNLIVNDGVSSSVAGRIEIWSRGFYMVQDFPFTGIGMGMHEKMVEVMYPYFINPVLLAHAHNLFLQVAVDLGIPGLIAWLGILANVIVACITLIRSREPLLRAAGAGLLASNVALCVHGLTDAVTWGMVRTAPLVWALWGLALGASLLCQPPARKVQPPEPAP